LPVTSRTTSVVEGLSYRVGDSHERSHVGGDSGISLSMSSSSSLSSLTKMHLEEPVSSNWGHFVDFYSSETDDELPHLRR
jgi:hypothetical protein